MLGQSPTFRKKKKSTVAQVYLFKWSQAAITSAGEVLQDSLALQFLSTDANRF